MQSLVYLVRVQSPHPPRFVSRETRVNCLWFYGSAKLDAISSELLFLRCTWMDLYAELLILIFCFEEYFICCPVVLFFTPLTLFIFNFRK